MKRSLLAMMLVLFFATLAAAEEWQKLESFDGNFKIAMPGKPTQNIQQVPTEVGEIPMFVYAYESENGKVAYMLMYNDYPVTDEGLAELDSEDMLNNCRDGVVEASTAEMVKEEEIMLMKKYPGRDFRLKGKVDDQEVRMYWRTYLVGRRLYQLAVIYSGEAADEEAIKKFHASFALLRG